MPNQVQRPAIRPAYDIIDEPLLEALLGTAILHTLAYADIFDYPLTTAEVHRYLVGAPASPEQVRAYLANGGPGPGVLACRQGYFSLAGREAIVDVRRRRAEVAARLWPRAIRYGRVIAGLPFVRMVALTGALAMYNVEPGADMDYLIVTKPGRLWLCRALVIVLVRLVASSGYIICPNYFLTEQALALPERNLFSAHELVQMVPLAGQKTYERMRRLNAWTARFLPNAGGPPDPRWLGQRQVDIDREGRLIRRAAEAVLGTPAGERLEQWEMKRKIDKLNQQRTATAWPAAFPAGGSYDQTEAQFCDDWCKGHFDHHGQRTLAAFNHRLQMLEKRA